MACDLLQPVAWVDGHRVELAGVRWKTPEGVKVRNLHWRKTGVSELFPVKWAGADRILAISPFVDDWGRKLLEPTSKQALVTTEVAAAGLNSTGNTDVYAVEKTPVAEPMDVDASSEGPVGETPAPMHARRALHAKLILMRRGERARLWIGSANLTRRGMLGPNAEVLAELDVPVGVADDLEAFKTEYAPFQPKPCDPIVEAEAVAARELDEAATAVLQATFELRRHPDGLRLTVAPSLDQFLVEHRLHVWLLTQPDKVVEWSSGTSSVLLVPGGIALKLETTLVAFTAERRVGGCASRHWAQNVPFPEHNPQARDAAASASYIQLSSAGAWLRSQLSGIVLGEGMTWTGTPRWAGSEYAGSADPLPLALEEVLGAWARNPQQFEQRAIELEPTVVALGNELSQADTDNAAAAAEWTQVETFWQQIRCAIPEPDHA